MDIEGLGAVMLIVVLVAVGCYNYFVAANGG